MQVRDLILNHPSMWQAFCSVNNTWYRMRFHGIFMIGKGVYFHKLKVLESGKNNRIAIENDCKLQSCSIQISGSLNTVVIQKGCRLTGLDICIEDNNNTVILGENTTCAGPVHLACIEGKSIEIGKNCMLSGNVVMRVGDSHSILNEAGERVNPSASILIKEHVWIGNDVKILKGVILEENTIVGTGAIVTKSSTVNGAILTGNPAKVVKTGFNWDIDRIDCKEN